MRSLIFGLFCLALGVAMILFSSRKVNEAEPRTVFQGIASHYGMDDGFHGKCMADGRLYDKEGMTAAHRSLRLGSKVRVTYKEKSVLLTITDRGPYKPGRVIDVSEAAARTLGLIQKGIDQVTIEVLEEPRRSQKYHRKNPECLKKNGDFGEPSGEETYAKVQ